MLPIYRFYSDKLHSVYSHITELYQFSTRLQFLMKNSLTLTLITGCTVHHKHDLRHCNLTLD